MKLPATLLTALSIILGTAMPAVWADVGSDGPDPVPSKLVRLVESEQYDRAIPELEDFVIKNKKSADGKSGGPPGRQPSVACR